MIKCSRLLTSPLDSDFNFEDATASNPSNSYLETCVLAWCLGDYFSLPELCRLALKRIIRRLGQYLVQSRSISSMYSEISFLYDLEAGIRTAWRADRITGPTRVELMTMATVLHPYLRYQPSFISLLDELPEFATDFVKALLGCPGVQHPTGREPRLRCRVCSKIIFDQEWGEDKEVAEGACAIITRSLDIYAERRSIFCSDDCYLKFLFRGKGVEY